MNVGPITTAFKIEATEGTLGPKFPLSALVFCDLQFTLDRRDHWHGYAERNNQKIESHSMYLNTHDYLHCCHL